jgi:hypothetical protein
VCTPSTAAPLPLSALQYDARPNPPVNLLQNGDVEAGIGPTPTGWRVDASPAGSTLTWDTARALSGTHALLVTTTSPGRAAWAQDVGAVEAGLRYRLRANIFAAQAGVGTHALEIFWLDGSGNEVGHDALQSNLAAAWAEVDGFVTAPSAAAKATVAVSAFAPGDYTIDDVMLVTAEPDPFAIAGQFPLGFWSLPTPGVVKNPEFGTQGAPGAPLAWLRSLASGDATVRWSGDGTTSSATLDIVATSACDASWFQNVDVNIGHDYVLQASISASSTAPGAHQVEVKWLDEKGNALGTDSVTAGTSGTWSNVSSAPLKPPPGTTNARVAFRVGQPGMYSVRSVRLVPAPGSPPLFDYAGAGFGFSVDDTSSLPRPYALGGYAAYQGLRFVTTSSSSSVTAAASDPTTALWLAGDEIAWTSPPYPVGDVVTNYQAVKSAGPRSAALPVWLNHAPRGTRAEPTNYDLLRPYSDGADIISMDVYPVPATGHAALPNEGPWSVGDYVDIVRRSTAAWNGAQRKVMWMVLQGFAWWEETGGQDVGDHGVAVEWRDSSNNVLRVDTVGADRTNSPRNVTIDGMIPPVGAAEALVKVGAYRKGTYTFDGIVFAEQGGRTLVQGSGPQSFHDAPGEVVIGRTQVRQTARYSLFANIVAQSRPTLIEERFMAWDAIIHGARGLSWFGFQYVSEADGLLADIGQVTRELHDVSADLLATTSLRDIRTSNAALEATLLHGSDGLLLAVANRTGSSVTGTVAVGGAPVSSVTRQGEGWPVSAEGNAVVDEFAPLAVHLYRLR